MYVVKINGTNLKIYPKNEISAKKAIQDKDNYSDIRLWGSYYGYFTTIVDAKIWALSKKISILNYFTPDNEFMYYTAHQQKTKNGEMKKIQMVLDKYKDLYPEYFI